MRASNCFFIFLVLLIAVRAFPQSGIVSVTESPAILGDNAVNVSESAILGNNVVNASEPAIDPILDGGESNETSIAHGPEIIANETVVSTAANEGIPSEVSIIQNANDSANEILVATIPREPDVMNEASNVEVPEFAINETVVNEVTTAPSEEVSAIASNAPVEVDAVDQVQVETVFENFSLRSIIPSTAAPSLPSPQSVSEVESDVPATEVVIAAANASLPAISTRNLDPEASVSSPSTPVPETTSVAVATEAQVSNISAIIFGDESKIPLPFFESPTSTNEVLGQFADIEVIIPLVDVSLSTISGRSLGSEPVAAVLDAVPDVASNISSTDIDSVSVPDFAANVSSSGIDSISVPDSVSNVSSSDIESVSVPDSVSNVSSSDIDLVSSTTQAAASISSTTAIPVPTAISVESVAVSESEITANVPDSSTGSPNIEVAPLPAVSSRALNEGAPDNVSESTILTTVFDSGSINASVIESVSSTTEVPAPSSTTSGLPEVESIAPANDSSVVVSSTGIPSIEVPQTSESEISSRALEDESPTSTTEAPVANISTSVSELESGLPTESVSSTTSVPVPSTTAAPVLEVSTEVPEVVIPVADANATEDASRSLEPDSGSVSSTTSGPGISSSVVPESVVPSESDVTSPTEASVIVDSTPSPSTTESPISSQTSSIPCTSAGNFSVPTNCRIYRTCSTDGTDLTLQEHECPEGYAFSPVLRRCSRDISPCGDSEPACLRSGSVADPNTSSAYYWCVPSILGGYHKYHVQCDTNEVYVSSISRCLPEALHLSHRIHSDSRSDRDIVKAEWKILKKEIKHQAKEDKVRQKLESKAKAHAHKLATKNLKRQKGDTKRHDDSDDDDDDEDED